MVKAIKKIGIFDSGLGGVSILKPLLLFPGLEFVYYADTAHLPYGNRSQEEIQALSCKGVMLLVQQDVDLIIIACHTIATNALHLLIDRFPSTPFVSVVDHVIDNTLNKTRNGHIGILATQATARSKAHERRLYAHNQDLKIFTQACPNLASVIEQSYTDTETILQWVRYYTQPLLQEKIDTLILACTHYALIQDSIKTVVEDSVVIISAEQSIAQWLFARLDINTKEEGIPSTVQWLITGNSTDFKKTVTLIAPSITFEA